MRLCTYALLVSQSICSTGPSSAFILFSVSSHGHLTPGTFQFQNQTSLFSTFDAEMGSVLESPPSTKEFQENLPYWQVNVPVAEREEECPGFLRNVAPKDQEILSTPQSAYHLMPWSELSEHIKNNRLDIFQRTPLDLRKYCAFNYSVVQQYGSILDFIQKVKLHWDSPIVAKKAPFEEEEDIKVQWNDWPYGIQEGVVHLVVWVKFAFEEERPNGDLSERERKRIDGFVEERFRKKLGAEKVGNCQTEQSEVGRLIGCRCFGLEIGQR